MTNLDTTTKCKISFLPLLSRSLEEAKRQDCFDHQLLVQACMVFTTRVSIIAPTTYVTSDLWVWFSTWGAKSDMHHMASLCRSWTQSYLVPLAATCRPLLACRSYSLQTPDVGNIASLQSCHSVVWGASSTGRMCSQAAVKHLNAAGSTNETVWLLDLATVVYQ